MSVNNLVKKFIDGNKVALFSKSFCPFCHMAKDVLVAAGEKDAAVMELDQVSEGPEIQAELTKMENHRTVPYVYIHQKFIGGGTDLRKLYDSGELVKMLEQKN